MKTLKNIIKKGSLLGIFAVAIIAASCESEEMPSSAISSDPVKMDIKATLDEISNNPDYIANYAGAFHQNNYGMEAESASFTMLSDALDYTGLAETVATGEFTILAPTDQAFENLMEELELISIYELTAEDLTEVLLYHVFPGSAYSTNLSPGYANAANGLSMRISAQESYMFNDASLMVADIATSNGVIHVIDKVLLPPTIVDLAMGNENFSILVEAVAKAGLVETLKTGEFTVFAPTNDAFIALLGELGFSSLDDIPVDVLTEVLLYHVVAGKVFSSDLPSEPISVTTAQSQEITIDASATRITADDSRVANLIGFDITGTNGVIHLIDTVILPNLSNISE